MDEAEKGMAFAHFFKETCYTKCFFFKYRANSYHLAQLVVL